MVTVILTSLFFNLPGQSNWRTFNPRETYIALLENSILWIAKFSFREIRFAFIQFLSIFHVSQINWRSGKEGSAGRWNELMKICGGSNFIVFQFFEHCLHHGLNKRPGILQEYKTNNCARVSLYIHALYRNYPIFIVHRFRRYG